jgi:branched-chain amino acid transport system permease protein
VKPYALRWEPAIFLLLLAYPLLPFFEGSFFALTKRSLGDQMPTVFIFAILALGLNVVVGYTGLLHLGIAAFFAVGAYTAGILTVGSYPFNVPFPVALIAGTLIAALLGVLLGVPTLRLRGDYVALVTLGFAEVVRFGFKNLDAITAGAKGLGPLPPPDPTVLHLDWVSDYRPFYYLTLGLLIAVVYLLSNLERSRLGRAWVALREDELAANCMGLNPAKLKLAAFALGSGLAGMAGVLYATRLTSTAAPDAYDFNRSVNVLCCVILGGIGSRTGVLLGVFLLVGFDNILSPILDTYIQQAFASGESRIYRTFTGWRLIVFGLALILMMRFRPEGLVPEARVKHEMHPDEDVKGAVTPVTMAGVSGKTGATS